VLQLKKKTVDRGLLASLIVKDINSGGLPPGGWLKQIDLEQRYGCSRLDVRRALDQLVIKHIVQHIPNRGYYAQAPNLEQLADIREIRVALECAAVDQMDIDGADLDALEDIAKRFSLMVQQGTLFERYDTNLAFHRFIYALCRNKEMVLLIEEIRNRYPSATVATWTTHARTEQSDREHFLMIEALRARDPERLKKLIAAHIRQVPVGD
jgi:DNA-binding GntR family transcriptional regulator